MNSDKSHHKILSLQFHSEGFSFCTLRDQKVLVQEDVSIKTSSPYEFLDVVKAKFLTNLHLGQVYEKVVVSFTNKLFNLVPYEYFEEEKIDKMLEYNTFLLEKDPIRYNDIQRSQCKLVFSYFEELENFLVSKHPNLQLLHSGAVFIQGIYSRSRETEMHVNVHENLLELIVLKEQKLQLYNIFEFNSKEDFLYYVLFVAEQLGWDANTEKLYYYGKIAETDALYLLLYKYIRNLEPGEDDAEFRQNFTLFTQPSCV